MSSGLLIAALGFALVSTGLVGLRRGAFWGNLYKVSRDKRPIRFYTFVGSHLTLGLFGIVAGIVISRIE